MSAPNVFFDLTEEVIPITINNKTEEEITIYKNTTLGFSKILPEAVINNISKLPKPLPTPIKNKKYELNFLKKSVDKDTPKRFHDLFGSLVKELSDISSNSEWDLGKCDVTTHRIEVEPESKPVKIPILRMPLHYKEDLQKKNDVFMEKDLITPCRSPYSAPAVLVPKKNGKLRLIIDYRQLNKQTIKSKWPIPSILEIFDTLEGSAYFTSIDMSAWFYHGGASAGLHSFQYTIWIFQVATHADGINWKPADFPISGRKNSCWSDLKNLCALSGRYYHIFVNPKRTLRTIATCFRKIPCTQFENQSR